MTGRGSIRHNNRSFSAANVDRSRSGQNVTFCNEDLKKVYHELFDEALAAYNAKKKKTRDKIPDYYEHIRQSKQEKLFHEAIFQIGNLTDCGCGSPGGERAAAKTGNPLSGDVYLFCGKKRDMIKLLRWQEDGFILYQKRLEDGTFELPRFNPREDWNKIEWKTFMMIMSGISLNTVKYRKRLRL